MEQRLTYSKRIPFKVYSEVHIFFAQVFSQVCVFAFTFRGVCESEARFGISQLVEVMEAHYIWSLKMTLGVLVAFAASSHFIVKFGG